MSAYIRRHPEIRDAIISGGDPLSLPLEQLDFILGELRSIPHLEIIRIGTRVPVVLPMKITPELVAVLENCQQADGSVRVPDVLVSYMGGLRRIEP